MTAILPSMGPEAVDEVAVGAANDAFYAAFEARDLDAMDAVWEHSDRVWCTHPGWPRLLGWEAVRRSWGDIFGGPQQLQFVLTAVEVGVRGDVGWVHLDENLLDGARTGTVAALNLFVRGDDGRWAVIGHHGSGVVTR
jgi:ketosteroid isomerase-like protein